MPAERFSIRVSKDYFLFCCAHFITYDGDECERLHGHNYRVAVEVEGPLDPNRYVFDFVAIKRRTQSIVDELDHHMLLATENPRLPVSDGGDNFVVRFDRKTWSFPKEDCVLLPIGNTTAELLAQWFAGRLSDELSRQYAFAPTRLRVEVEEATGQSAAFEIRAEIHGTGE